MVLVDGVPKSRTHHMSVDLGGGNVGVAEHRLNAAQVGAAFQQVGRGRVAEAVRAGVRR